MIGHDVIYDLGMDYMILMTEHLPKVLPPVLLLFLVPVDDSQMAMAGL